MTVPTERFLALDVGEARVGLAKADPLGLLATPFDIVSRKQPGAEKRIAEIARTTESNVIVVGLPLHMNGKPGAQAHAVRQFIEKLVRLLPPETKVVYQDERLTTRMAQLALHESGASKSKRQEHDDARAAAVLLQMYLDRRAAAARAQPKPAQSEIE